MLVVLRSVQDTQRHCVKGVLTDTASDTGLVDVPNGGCTLVETAVVYNIVLTAEGNITTAASLT
jgi:hypothetical protein